MTRYHMRYIAYTHIKQTQVNICTSINITFKYRCTLITSSVIFVAQVAIVQKLLVVYPQDMSVAVRSIPECTLDKMHARRPVPVEPSHISQTTYHEFCKKQVHFFIKLVNHLCALITLPVAVPPVPRSKLYTLIPRPLHPETDSTRTPCYSDCKYGRNLDLSTKLTDIPPMF